jgi:hypothetical protein
LLIGIGASAGGLPLLLGIIHHLSSGYQGEIFVAMHRRPMRHYLLGSSSDRSGRRDPCRTAWIVTNCSSNV